jgi:hypothetical protein
LDLLNEHERFWLDCIRAACPDGVPAPTLARAQALRWLFKAQVPPLEHQWAGDDLP